MVVGAWWLVVRAGCKSVYGTASGQAPTTIQTGLTTPSCVARLLRTRVSAATTASSGIRLAAIRIGSNEYRSATTPVRYVAVIVPIPAPVPLIPLTEATEPVG